MTPAPGLAGQRGPLGAAGPTKHLSMEYLSAWGIGGGTLLLLVMTLVFGVDQTAAQGINLLYFLPTAAMGLIWHRQNGLLDKAVLRRTVPWALAAAAAGAWAATALDVTLLRRPFGLFLLAAAVLTLRQK